MRLGFEYVSYNSILVKEIEAKMDKKQTEKQKHWRNALSEYTYAEKYILFNLIPLE